jgi:cytochrome c55X
MNAAPCAITTRSTQPKARRFNLFSPCFIAAICILAGAFDSAWASETLDAARRSELITLVRQDCGSCHGLTLKGGLGPALLPQTLQNKPASSLKATILQGRPGTAMPPWGRFLSDAEADWIVTNLQKGFPSD